MPSQLIGKTVCGYKLNELIGESKFGAVYRGHDKKSGRDAAIKVVAKSVLDEAGIRSRFISTARAWLNLQHAALLPIEHFKEDENYVYLVTPLMQESLAAALKRDTFSPEETKRVVSVIAEALDFLHAQGFVHRGVKPNNIFVDSEGNIFLADFGIAKWIDLENQYASPEQRRGESGDYCYDIYSLGAITQQMLGDATAAAISEAIAPNADDRYQSAGEFARALETSTIRSGARGAASPAPARWVWGVLITCLVLVCVFAIAAIVILYLITQSS
ncbi:MAG: serine/threonine protein kinase [Chloroflexi bacterium]|nr:serine/threonine protein kinase [Chloroflexota bacterium]